MRRTSRLLGLARQQTVPRRQQPLGWLLAVQAWVALLWEQQGLLWVLRALLQALRLGASGLSGRLAGLLQQQDQHQRGQQQQQQQQQQQRLQQQQHVPVLWKPMQQL